MCLLLKFTRHKSTNSSIQIYMVVLCGRHGQNLNVMLGFAEYRLYLLVTYWP